MLLLTKSTENKEMELHKNSICNIIWILFCQQESMEHFKQGGSGIKFVSWKITVCKNGGWDDKVLQKVSGGLMRA